MLRDAGRGATGWVSSVQAVTTEQPDELGNAAKSTMLTELLAFLGELSLRRIRPRRSW